MRTARGQRKTSRLPALAWLAVVAITSLGGDGGSLLAQDAEPASATEPPAGSSASSDVAGEASGDAAILTTTELPVEEIPWEVRPYRVLVSLAFAPSPGLTQDFRAKVQGALHAQLAGLLGDYWHTEVTSNRWLFPAAGAALDRLSADDFSGRFHDAGFDKVIVLTVEHKVRLRLSGCEWDRTLGERGPILQRDVIDRRRTAAVVLEMLFELFRPLARIEPADDGTIELRARAGELLAPRSVPVMFQTGDLLIPHFRYLDREQQVRSIQAVPWTYLRVEDIGRSRMIGSEQSAFAAPLAGRRRRVELIGLRARPSHPATRLRLVPRNQPSRPLVGVRVRVYDHLPTEEQPDPEMTELMTDRFGHVEIPRSADAPLKRLIVHSGGAVIANAPFVAGLEADVSMELPDDTVRLQAEGRLGIVEGELIDVVSRRNMLLARAVSMARKGEFELADGLMDQVDRQPSVGSFKSKILAIRVPLVAEARRNRDRSAERRIVGMCSELEDVVARYLDRDSVRDAAAEIGELKNISSGPG